MRFPTINDALVIYDPRHCGVIVVPDVVSLNARTRILHDIKEYGNEFQNMDREYKHATQRADMLYLGCADHDNKKDVVIGGVDLLTVHYTEWYGRFAAAAGFEPEMNSIGIHRYRAGTIGITPHLEHSRYRNLVSVIVLEGNAPFSAGPQREGQHTVFEAPPGSMILMRAPRNDHEIAVRPFHSVGAVTQERYAVIYRQIQKGEPFAGVYG